MLLTCGLRGQESPVTSAVGADYKISPGDIVKLSTFNDPKGNGILRVSRQGFVEHPYMGPVRIAGFTASQAARALEVALRGDYLVSPRVTITVMEYAKISFVVLGAVSAPGNFDAAANKHITIIQAIAQAGGFKDVANQKKVILRRIVNGRVEPYTVNVKALLEKNLRPVYIQDGDTIEVRESLF
ncbi:MAG: protein involved in polysaccharide export with SLBB domain [Verrucomicrobiales bacterium]|jgi:polysaccharide export outer membrane protein